MHARDGMKGVRGNKGEDDASIPLVPLDHLLSKFDENAKVIKTRHLMSL